MSVKPIADAISQALSLWKKYIETRQSAYNRKMDRRKEKALNIAEEAFEEFSMYHNYVSRTCPLTDETEKRINKFWEKVLDLKRKFDRYD